MILGVAEMAQMDIDLELMRKDRSQCTQLELEQIRRERNRMHAKRTRVRKKVQMEELQDAINNVRPTLSRGDCPWLCWFLVFGFVVLTSFISFSANTKQLERTNFHISERIAWLDSKSFRVTYEEDIPLVPEKSQ